MNKPAILILLAAMLVPVFVSTLAGQPAPLRIAVSKASPNYINWLKKSDPAVVTFDMYNLTADSAAALLASCDALLVTGGDDIYPALYGREKDTASCTGFDRRRDTLEVALIKRALKVKMPVFGICRGHQLLNAFLGGTLYTDIPGEVPAPAVHQCDDYLNCFHTAYVQTPSLLEKITRCDSAMVTTNHHQAVWEVAPTLRVNARSADGLPEGIEWKDPAGKSFLLGVQWHPERMDKENPLSGYLADIFIAQATRFHDTRNKALIK